VVAPETYQVADLSLDVATQQVTRSGRTLVLTPIGFRLLTALMRASPRVVSRAELERQVWGEVPPDSDALRSHLYSLRKAIDRPFDRPLLHTVSARGYRLADDGAR
jgi:DNA-binding response OmpR family regulator